MSFTALANQLKTAMTPGAIADATTPRDHHGWAAAWVTDSLRQAVTSQAFPSSLKNGRVKEDTHGGEDSVLATIASPAKNAYIANHVAAGRTQLVFASVRLAALFNAITWP